MLQRGLLQEIAAPVAKIGPRRRNPARVFSLVGRGSASTIIKPNACTEPPKSLELCRNGDRVGGNGRRFNLVDYIAAAQVRTASDPTNVVGAYYQRHIRRVWNVGR